MVLLCSLYCQCPHTCAKLLWVTDPRCSRARARLRGRKSMCAKKKELPLPYMYWHLLAPILSQIVLSDQITVQIPPSTYLSA